MHYRHSTALTVNLPLGEILIALIRLFALGVLLTPNNEYTDMLSMPLETECY